LLTRLLLPEEAISMMSSDLTTPGLEYVNHSRCCETSNSKTPGKSTIISLYKSLKALGMHSVCQQNLVLANT